MVPVVMGAPSATTRVRTHRAKQLFHTETRSYVTSVTRAECPPCLRKPSDFFVFRFPFSLSQIVSDNAVFARDFLAGAYVASKDRAGEVAGATVHKSLQVRA